MLHTIALIITMATLTQSKGMVYEWYSYDRPRATTITTGTVFVSPTICMKCCGDDEIKRLRTEIQILRKEINEPRYLFIYDEKRDVWDRARIRGFKKEDK